MNSISIQVRQDEIRNFLYVTGLQLQRCENTVTLCFVVCVFVWGGVRRDRVTGWLGGCWGCWGCWGVGWGVHQYVSSARVMQRVSPWNAHDTVDRESSLGFGLGCSWMVWIEMDYPVTMDYPVKRSSPFYEEILINTSASKSATERSISTQSF